MVEEVSNPRVELADFREQDGVPDFIKSSRYVQRDGPNLMSDIVGLHPLLEEKKQHVQGSVTRSESQLMI